MGRTIFRHSISLCNSRNMGIAVSPNGKAWGFGSHICRFESCYRRGEWRNIALKANCAIKHSPFEVNYEV